MNVDDEKRKDKSYDIPLRFKEYESTGSGQINSIFSQSRSSLSDKSNSDITDNTMCTSTAPGLRRSPPTRKEGWSSMMSLKSWTSSSKSLPSSKKSRSDAILECGDVHFAAGDYDEAIEFYEKFLNIAITKYPYSNEKVIIAYERVAHAQAMCDQKLDAVVNYRNALSGLELKMQENEKKFDVESKDRLRRRFSRILINCANTLLKISEESEVHTEIAAYCDQAIDYYKDALPFVQEQYGVSSSESMTLAQRLCMARESLIQNIYANKPYKAAVQYRENIYFLKPYMVDMVKESNIKNIETNKFYRSILALFSRQTINLGLLYLKQNRLDDVLDLFEDSLQTIGLSGNGADEKILKILPEVVTKYISTLLHNMGVVCQKKNMPLEAALHYSRVVYLKKMNNLCPGYSLLGLGESYFEIDEYDQALKHLLDAERRLNFDQSDTYNEAYDMCFNNIATIYESRNNLDDCIIYLKKQIKFLRKCISNKSQLAERESLIWHRIACIHVKLDNLDNALHAHKQSLVSRRKIHNTADLSLTLRSIGQIEYKLERFEIAYDSYYESLQYLEDKEKISILFEMGNCLYQINSDYEAIEQYESCLSLAMKVESDSLDAHVIASCIDKLGLLLIKLEGYDRAIANYRDALELIVDIGGDVAREKSEILLGLGNAHLGLCLYDQAMCHYIQAKELLSKNDLSLYYEEFKKCLFCTADAYEKMNETDKCLKCLRDLIDLTKVLIKDELDYENHLVTIFHKIACVQYRVKKYDDCLESHKRILSLKMKACGYGNKDETANKSLSLTLCDIGTVYVEKKMYKDALNNYKRALVNVDRTTKALVLCEIGKVLVLLKLYDEALYHFESALSRIEGGSTSKVLVHMGTFHATQKKFDQAVTYYEKAISLSSETFIEERKNLLLCLEKKNFKPKSNVEALEWFYSTMDQFGLQEFCTTYESIETVLNEIVRHLLRENDFDSCMKCLKHTITIETLFISNKIDLYIKITKSLDRLGYIQQKVLQYDNAIESYDLSLHIKENLYKNKNPDTSITYHSIGDTYVAKGEYQLGLNNLREALEGACFKDKIILLDKIGKVLHKSGHNNGAIDCYQSALLLCGDKKTEERMLLLNNLGNIQLHAGNLKGALSCYIEAQASPRTKQHLHNQSNFILLNMGLLFCINNSKRKSFQSFKKFLSIKVSEVVLKNDNFDLDILFVLNYVGFLLYKQRSYKESIEWFQHCIRLMQSLPTPNEDLLNGAVSNLCSSYFCLHQYDCAWPLLIKVIDVYKEKDNRNERLLVSLLLKSARIRFHKKKYDTSLDDYEQARSLMKKNGQLSGEVSTLHNIALVYCKKHNFLDASKILNDVQHEKILRYGQNHPEVAKVLIDLGSLNMKIHKYAEAESYIYQASDILERSKCLLDHPYYFQLEKVMAKFNKKAETTLRKQGEMKNIDTRTNRAVRFKT